MVCEEEDDLDDDLEGVGGQEWGESDYWTNSTWLITLLDAL